MINVLSIVSYKFLPPDMGGQKGIALFNRYLSKQLCLNCVTVKANTLINQEEYAIQNILSDHASRYFNIFYFFTLRKIIREKKITHLILEHPYYGWLGILLKKFCGVKLIVHSHNIEATRFKSMHKWWWRILWHYEKMVHRHASENFFITAEDRSFAIANYSLHAACCHVITYGFEMQRPPADTERLEAKRSLQSLYDINEGQKILLFNGTLAYKPNTDALDVIINHINPLLLADKDFDYKILICGKGLPGTYDSLKPWADKNIIYAGFVEDITLYFKGADIFINPVNDGGGIKTKLVEALGYGVSVVSTVSGAIGISPEISGTKMQIVDNTDWQGFALAIKNSAIDNPVPLSFFEHFYWGNIAAKAASIIR